MRKRALWAGLFVFFAANAVAFFHARSMTRYEGSGVRTGRPEELSLVETARLIAFGAKIPKPQAKRLPSDLGLAAQDVRIVEPDGSVIAGWFIGKRRAKTVVLILHGYGSERSSLLEEAKAFSDLGAETLLIDFSGHGESEGTRTSIGWGEAEEAAAALAFLRKKRPGSRIVVYGSSMGAAAAARAVSRGASPDALVLESSFGRMLDAVETRFRLAGLPSFPFARLMVFWGGFQNGFNAFHHNPEEYAKSIAVPALVLHGSRDRRVSEQEARRVLENLSGPKRLVVFEAGGHSRLLKSDPGLWRREMKLFLDTLLRGGRHD